MGLLSDPEYRSVRWVRVLQRVHRPLCALCCAAALAWLALLAHRDFNNETYFSENALLPGLVTTEFNAEHAATQFFTEFTQELRDKYDDTDEMPIPWLVGKMSQLHLEVYTHNFTLDYPLGKGQVYKGTNVYGILRAARTPSLEALVLTAPYRPRGSPQKGTAAGIALMLAFAQFARPQKYWAKDIIFLVTEHEQLGMQAWLEAYHGLRRAAPAWRAALGALAGRPAPPRRPPGLHPGALRGRSGAIQAAINLEFHTPKIKYIEVKVEGLNGQLPNLDLSNLVHKLCVKSGIHHSYKNSYSWVRRGSKVEEWAQAVHTLLGQLVTQMAGVPNGNHGLFHRFGVEAVTLEGRDARDPAPAPRAHALAAANFHRLGVALESIMRSLNNLLERFHQSYFFYLLAATNRFISIGQYMPSLCLLCGAMLLRALSLWVTTQQDNEDEEKPKKTTSQPPTDAGDDESKEPVPEKSKKSKKKSAEQSENSFSVVNVGANYLCVHLVGYAVMNAPVLLTQIGSAYDQPSEVSVYYGLVAISVLVALAAPWLPRALGGRRASREELALANILLLVELCALCACAAVHNAALGLVLAALYTPLALVAGVVSKDGGRKSSVALFLRRALCLLLHPLAAVTLGMAAYSRAAFPEDSWRGAAGRGRDAAMQALMFSVADSMIYGNWLFNVVATTLFPVWIGFWQILCNKVDPLLP